MSEFFSQTPWNFDVGNDVFKLYRQKAAGSLSDMAEAVWKDRAEWLKDMARRHLPHRIYFKAKSEPQEVAEWLIQAGFVVEQFPDGTQLFVRKIDGKKILYGKWVPPWKADSQQVKEERSPYESQSWYPT